MQKDSAWSGPVKKRAVDGSEDVYIKMSFQTTFTSNNKYFSWMFIFLLLLIIFSSAVVVSTGFYIYYRYQYFKYANEKRQIKRELMKIKDTEY